MKKKLDATRDIDLFENYYRSLKCSHIISRKKFAREARWENWKERIYRILEWFHINSKSYAEEYEEFVTQKMKQKTRESSRENGSNRSSSNSRDFYQILGVDRSASQEEIMRNFRVKIMQTHPDYYQ